MLRAALLCAADSRALRSFVTRHGRRFGAYRFVAGETLDEFLTVVRVLNGRGIRVAAGLLGEDVRDRDEAQLVARRYEEILTRFSEERLNANVALKLTHLGLAIDPELAYENVCAVVRHAASVNNFVRIDMEQSAYTDATLAIYRRLRSEGCDNVGTVLQAYLYRTGDDLAALLALRPNLRLVKGAYLESSAIAFPRKRDVDRNYLELLEAALSGARFTAIATHDDAAIEHCVQFIRQRAIPSDRYEFQMLYGVRPKLQASLLAQGFGLRLAVPFGSHWYPYFMRRLAERPANVFFLLSSIWRG